MSVDERGVGLPLKKDKESICKSCENYGTDVGSKTVGVAISDPSPVLQLKGLKSSKSMRSKATWFDQVSKSWLILTRWNDL